MRDCPFARVNARVRPISSACWLVVLLGSGPDSTTFSRETMAYPAHRIHSWRKELPSVNHTKVGLCRAPSWTLEGKGSNSSRVSRQLWVAEACMSEGGGKRVAGFKGGHVLKEMGESSIRAVCKANTNRAVEFADPYK